MKRIVIQLTLLWVAIVVFSASLASSQEDLSQGRTFTFLIASNLPTFTFKLVPLPRSPDQFGNAQSAIRDIEVYRGDSKHALQHLTGCDLEGMEPPGVGAEFFLAEDINFDGYRDIFLQTYLGATGNWGGCVWLFNPATGSFDYSKDFSYLSQFRPDPATRTIFTLAYLGMAGSVYRAQRYAVEESRPLLIWSENQDWDDPTKRFHCVVKKRRGAKMVVVQDLWSKAGEDPPCDPARIPN